MNNSLINLNVSKFDTLLKLNCSVYNPCGRYGYCENDNDGQWSCVCKFWWNGILCDTLSSSGKQVIALGIVTGLLIGLYYGLTLFHWFKKRRKEETKDKITLIVNRKRYRHLNDISKPYCGKFWWLTVVGTVIVSICAILIRWSIISRIHNEIIFKYKHNESLFYTRPSICRVIYIREELNLLTFPVGCFLILLFVIITKRKSSNARSCCSGYIGIPIPLDFFSHTKRRFAAIIFGIVADDLTNVALELLNGGLSPKDEGIIITYLLQIVRVFTIGFRCYPILCAVYINSRLTLICACLYSWFDISVSIGLNGVCRNDYYSTNDNYYKTNGEGTKFFLEYYGIGSKLIYIQLISDIPRYLFLSFICIRLLILVYKRLKDVWMPVKELTREEENLLYSSLPNSIESRYVENLFGLIDKKVPRNRLKRLFEEYIYKWRDDFKFSSRIICVYASIFFLLFFVTVQACVQGPPYIGEVNTSSDVRFPHFVRSYLFGVFVALIVITIQLFLLLGSIRRNLLQSFRGDNSEIPRRNSSENVSYACANIHFAGYLIGNVLWGYLLIGIVTILIGIGIDLIITYEWISFLEYILKGIIPPILFALFQNYLNKILGEYVFLQDGGNVLSINHRRILMIFLYFNFFLDALLGLVSSIVRVLKSTIGGIIYMCRLDYSSFGRKLEKYDAGFSAYCGFIHMECAHRHPVLLYFTSLLLRQHLYGTELRQFSKARQRWDLAFFLLKNPTLIYRRKYFSAQPKTTDENKLTFIGRKNIQTMSIQEPSTTSI